MRYISYDKKRNRYIIRKWKNGRAEYFGIFKNREDAESHREYCIEHNWSEKCKLNRGSSIPLKRIADMFGLDVEDLPQ